MPKECSRMNKEAIGFFIDRILRIKNGGGIARALLAAQDDKTDEI